MAHKGSLPQYDLGGLGILCLGKMNEMMDPWLAGGNSCSSVSKQKKKSHRNQTNQAAININ